MPTLKTTVGVALATVIGLSTAGAVGASDSDSTITGDRRANVLVGTDGVDQIDGRGGHDVIIGLDGADHLTGGRGRDSFVYLGDPFEGVDVSAPGRDIVGEEDFITDFDVRRDRLVLAPHPGLGGREFFNGTAAELGHVDDAPNVIVLQDSDNDDDPTTDFLAGTAANLIAEQIDESGPGYFLYFNSRLGVNRWVYSTDLSTAEADLKIVNRLTDKVGQDAIDELPRLRARNVIVAGG